LGVIFIATSSFQTSLFPVLQFPRSISSASSFTWPLRSVNPARLLLITRIITLSWRFLLILNKWG